MKKGTRLENTKKGGVEDEKQDWQELQGEEMG